jgi:hypothetical protein
LSHSATIGLSEKAATADRQAASKLPAPAPCLSQIPIDATGYDFETWIRFAFDHPVSDTPWYYTEEMDFTNRSESPDIDDELREYAEHALAGTVL